MPYISIFYDFYKNKLYHRYLNPETNKPKTDIITPKYEYFIKDRTGNSDTVDIYGNSVIKKETENRDGLNSVMKSGVTTYETDIPQDIKFLNKTYGNDTLSVDMDNFNVCTIDIETSTNGKFSEVDKADIPINAITIKSSKNGQIYTFGLYDYTGSSDSVKNYVHIPNEKTLLEKFVKFFRHQKFNILTGWFIDGFDVPYLVNRMERLGVDYKKLSPYNIVNKKRGAEEYTIAGIAQLDYLALYKRFTFTDRESYSLDFIGNYEEVGGKLEYEGTISEIWKNDWNRWIEYNVQDVELVDKLDKKLRFIELAISICYESLIPFEQVFTTLPMHVGYCLKFLHNKKMVMPIKPDIEHKPFPGGYVFRKLGMHDYVVSFDVTSLYPTLIRMFNIGPETLRKDPKNIDGLIKTPISEYKKWVTANQTFDNLGGIYYDKSKKSVLVEIVESIFFGRIRDKKKKDICDLISSGMDNDDISKKIKMSFDDLVIIRDEIYKENGNASFYQNRQMVRKIQMNSLYGALGTPYFNFYNIDNAMAVTLSGQTLIRFLSDNSNKYLKMKYKLKNDVIMLIDTDSVDGSTKLDTSIGNIEISNLFDKCKDVKEYKTGKFIGELSENVMSDSFNYKTNKIEKNKIKYVMKHKVKKEMFKITVGDDIVICTSDHSVEVRRDGKIVSVSPRNIKTSDKLIVKKDDN